MFFFILFFFIIILFYVLVLFVHNYTEELIEQLCEHLEVASKLQVPKVESKYVFPFNEYLREDLPAVDGALNLLLLKVSCL